MKKYLLVSASGVSLLWLIAGFLPAQATLTDKVAQENYQLNPTDAATVITEFTASEKKNDYQQAPIHDQYLEFKDILDSKKQKKFVVAQQTNSQKEKIESVPTPTFKVENETTPNNTTSNFNSVPLTDTADTSIDQVTSVSQLSDVQPTDWAFQALQSLVERYGCIAGYPNGTFRGNRAMTRYEFAAGLNACLERVNELIRTGTENLARKADLDVIQRLQTEFSAELATLRGRVDALESRTAQLEAKQFSTTTKLSGEAIFAGIGATGGARDRNDPNIILVNRVRLNLNTSFTGKDLLITGLQSHNFLGGASGSGSVQESLGLASPILSSSSARTSFEPQFPGLDVKTLSPRGANSLELYKLLYIFPVANKVTLFAGTAAEVSDAFPAITPFYGEGQESISRFAGLNPVLRVSGGTSGAGLASAAGFIFNPSNSIDIRALYGSVNANLPQSAPDLLPGVSGTPLGAGLFSGSSVVAAQLTLKPSKAIDIGLNYANSYHEINILGTGLISSDIGALSGVPLGIPVKLNSFGGTVNFRFNEKVALSGYGAAIFVDDSSGRVDASTTFTSWMVGLHFKDLVKRGNTAGIIFGQPLYRTDASGAATRTVAGTDRATPYHLEGYYKFKVSDNISITPGAFVLFNPEGNSRNDTTYVGVLRTTFTF